MADIDLYSIEQFGESAAATYMLGLEAAFALLADYPEAGPAMPKLGKGIRCLVHRKHRIFYVVRDDVVLILRFVHGARDAKRALKG